MGCARDGRDSLSKMERLKKVMAALRGPDGCPWDQEQTHESLRPYLLEEAYEVWEAIANEDDGELCEELGDVLLQVVFHAQIAAEEGRFELDDVAEAVCEKLVRRHPHVFGEVEVEDAQEVVDNWERIKAAEKQKVHESRAEREQEGSRMSGIPPEMPALLKADKLQRKAAHVGFDWEEPEEVMEKVEEELAEVAAAVEEGDEEATEEEIGDLLFAVVNLARFLGHSAEAALDDTNRKFVERFHFIEKKAREGKRRLADVSLTEMDSWWESAKRLEEDN